MKGLKKDQIIYTNQDNCVGCNKCNLNCPSVYANISCNENGVNKINVDWDKCINCGLCIKKCDHDARNFNDNTKEFFADLKLGEKITVIAAPSIKFNFPNYKNLLGYLKNAGVNLIYDVSFGADIAVWMYVKVLQSGDYSSLISQPCPVVVNYIEKYKPELIKNLAPVQSPVICTAIYLKKYLKNDSKIAFLSPCVAKSSEFNNKHTYNIVEYNVTFEKLQEHLQKKKVNLEKYSPVTFDNEKSGMGMIFPTPGGLKENLKLFLPDLWVKQVEGTENFNKYLDSYAKRLNENKLIPEFVDILNCEKGCNIGSASIYDAYSDEMDYELYKFAKENLSEKSLNLFKKFEKELDIEDFYRLYEDKSEKNKMAEPTKEDYDLIYKQLYKMDEASRNINCYACGYGSCKDFAKAIFNGTNHKNNCIYYNRKALEIEHDSLIDRNEEIKTMLSELESLNNQLRKSETSTRTIIEKMIDGLIIVNKKGIIENSNPAAEYIFNYTVSELIGLHISKLLPDLILENTNISKDFRQEIIAKRNYNNEFPAEIGYSHIKIDKNENYIIIIRDISERKQVEKLKNEFVSVVSHELRTPITSIQGALGLLSADFLKNDAEKGQKLLEIALNNTKRLIYLINDILDIEKIEAGKMTFNPEIIDVLAITEQAIESNKYYASQFNVEYSLKTIILNTKVKADRYRLMQVLTNLLSNAAKFSPSGEIVEIELKKIDGMIRFSIQDKGSGIPKQFKDSIFQKFAQADSSDTRQKGGTGLGLSICKALIERMNGTINFESEENIGTNFYFDLPEFIK